MGFFVQESVTFPQYGVSATNCYVTIKASFVHVKFGAPGFGMYMGPAQPVATAETPYAITARFFVYTANEAELSPLRETTISLSSVTAFADPIASIYAAIKAQHFDGKTFTDDV